MLTGTTSSGRGRRRSETVRSAHRWGSSRARWDARTMSLGDAWALLLYTPDPAISFGTGRGTGPGTDAGPGVGMRVGGPRWCRCRHGRHGAASGPEHGQLLVPSAAALSSSATCSGRGGRARRRASFGGCA